MKIRQSFLIFAGAALLPCTALFAQENEAAETPAAETEERERPLPAPAAESGDAAGKPEVQTGRAVRVTAARHEMELLEVPMSVSVVDGSSVTKSSAATVGDLLQDVPGMQVSSTGHAFKQLSIRGEDNGRCLLLVDGQKITENSGMNGAPLLISVQDIERVEVVKGPASVLYGSEAIGGVVNVITKKGPKEDGAHGSVGVRGDTGTHGIDQYYSLSGRFGDFSARVSYSDEDHGNIEAPGGAIDDTDYRIQNTSAWLAYDLSENATVGLKYEMFRGRTSVHTGYDRMDFSLPMWDRDKVGAYVTVKDITKNFVKLDFNAFYQRTEKRFIQNTMMPPTASPMTLAEFNTDRLNKQNSYGAEIQADFTFADSHYFIIGAQVDYSDLNAEGTSYEYVSPMWSMATGQTPGTRTRYTDYDADQITLSAFAQDEWNFADGWDLVLGARGTFVHTSLDSGSNPVYNHASGTTSYEPYGSESDEDAHATFSLSLVNTQIENTALRATVSQGYRVATLNELYIGNAMMGAVTEANPSLDPETSTNYELGARYDDGKLILDVTVFYTDADDYITTETLGAYHYRFVNYDSSRAFGAELAAYYNFEIGKDAVITPYAVATWLRRRNASGSFSTYDTGSPELFGKAGVRASLVDDNRNWWMDLNVRANSQSDTTSEENGVRSTTSVAGWATYNAAFGVDITPARPNPYFGKLTLAFGIDNITDVEYELAKIGFYQPGRSYWLSLQYDF